VPVARGLPDFAAGGREVTIHVTLLEAALPA